MKKYVKISRLRLDMNWHGPGGTTLRRTWLMVRMRSWSHIWTVYLYRKDGSCIGICVAFPEWTAKQFGAKKKGQSTDAGPR